MAFIGLRYPVFAPITSEPLNGMPVYETPVKNSKAISASLTWTRNANVLYADDAIAESDNGITSGSLTVGLDDLSEELQLAALGTQKVGEEDAAHLEDTDAAGTPGGFGYIRVRRKGGVTTYEANWLYKVQLGRADESTNTRAESIEWQTPSITGAVMGVHIDDTGTIHYRRRKICASEAEARNFIDSLAANGVIGG